MHPRVILFLCVGVAGDGNAPAQQYKFYSCLSRILFLWSTCRRMVVEGRLFTSSSTMERDSNPQFHGFEKEREREKSRCSSQIFEPGGSPNFIREHPLSTSTVSIRKIYCLLVKLFVSEHCYLASTPRRTPCWLTCSRENVFFLFMFALMKTRGKSTNFAPETVPAVFCNI